MKQRLKALSLALLILGFTFAGNLSPILAGSAFADETEATDTRQMTSFSLSPMSDMITLTPGETFESTFTIVNPVGNTTNFYYELGTEPFTEDSEGNITAKENGHYTDMQNWIQLPKTEGVVAPNSSETIPYKIVVPEDAPAGGQYASIVVGSKQDEAAQEGINIHEVFQAVYMIYAEVAGETVRKGKMDHVSVPGFLFSGKISGSAEVTNEGNVHSPATYTLQVFPLFSKEEVYTNAEEPKTYWVMPGNSTLVRIAWDDTPKMGVFHVIYNVEYEGVNSNVDKFVIVCPIWLLLIIVAAIFLIIFAIIFGKKEKK